jgi:hypothetical protein
MVAPAFAMLTPGINKWRARRDLFTALLIVALRYNPAFFVKIEKSFWLSLLLLAIMLLLLTWQIHRKKNGRHALQSSEPPR